MSSLKKATVEISVNSPVSALWKVLHDDFALVGNFNPLLEGSHHVSGEAGIGCERQCDLKPDGKMFVKETITNTVHEKHMELRMSGGQFPMMKMDTVIGQYDLEERNDSTKVFLNIVFEAKPKFMGGILRSKLQKMLIKTLIGLKYYVETGGHVTKANFNEIEKLYYRLDDSASFTAKVAA